MQLVDALNDAPSVTRYAPQAHNDIPQPMIEGQVAFNHRCVASDRKKSSISERTCEPCLLDAGEVVPPPSGMKAATSETAGALYRPRWRSPPAVLAFSSPRMMTQRDSAGGVPGAGCAARRKVAT